MHYGPFNRISLFVIENINILCETVAANLTYFHESWATGIDTIRIGLEGRSHCGQVGVHARVVVLHKRFAVCLLFLENTLLRFAVYDSLIAVCCVIFAVWSLPCDRVLGV